MAQIGNIPEIVAVKEKLKGLQEQGLVQAWELPYENLLTRLDAAIFFLTPEKDTDLDGIWAALAEVPRFKYQENTKKTLSELAWQIEFNAEEGKEGRVEESAGEEAATES